MEAFTTTPHDGTQDCRDVHCWSCGVDESSDGAYQVCIECGHVYRTARSLRKEYRRVTWGYRNLEPRIPRWRILWTMVTVRASSITFCQHCVHDFLGPPSKNGRVAWLRFW